MDRKLLTVCFISLCVVAELALLWLGRRYYFRDPERKAKRQETVSEPIFIIVWGLIVFLALPFFGVVGSVGLLRGEGGLWALLIPLLLFRAGLYGCRWMLYYDREGFRLRRSFGKTRRYSYGDVKAIFPLFMDRILVLKDHRWTLIDALQDHQDFQKRWELWRIRSGDPVKHRQYRSKFGKAFLQNPEQGGLALFLFLLFEGFPVGAVILVVATDNVRHDVTGFVIFCLVMAVMVAIGWAMLLPLWDPERFQRLYRFWWGKSKFGKKRRK